MADTPPPNLDELQARIRVLEATVAVQRLGLDKAWDLLSEFDGDLIQHVATEIGSWIDYGRQAANYEAYETRVRGLYDLFQVILGIAQGVQEARDNPAEVYRLADWILFQIKEALHELPPLLRGTVCKLARGCPEKHVRDCQREIELRAGAMAKAEDAAARIVSNVARIFTANPEEDRDALALLVRALEVNQSGREGEVFKFEVKGMEVNIPAPFVPVLDQYWIRKDLDEGAGDPVQTIEREQ